MEHSVEREAGGLVRDAILIAGPTASGKSAAALELAERLGGVIVNTDSMQGYAVLDIISARPGAADLSRAPHELYGHVHPSISYSTGAWLRDVERLGAAGTLAARRPIFVGGTGLYFRALVEGLSEMPEIPANVRESWRNLLKERGPGALHDMLAQRDAKAAAGIKPSDGQRLVRALEVLEHSGRSILDWQANRGRPMIDLATARCFVIEPDRDELVRRINARFDGMIERGALDEVKTLLDLKLDPALPAMKAIGVRELAGVLDGIMSQQDAIERAKIATRQYSKRQATWFRNQFGPEWARVERLGEAQLRD